MVQKLNLRGYKQKESEDIITKVHSVERKQLLQPKPKINNGVSPIIITYHKNLPNIKAVLSNNWDILKTNNDISNLFQQQPNIAFRRNKNLRQIICNHRIHNNKIIKKKYVIGKCHPCLSRRDNLCCKQMVNTSIFTNRKTGKQYNILHKLNCKSSHVIYLIECTLCNYKPYVGKSEHPSNLRTNNHRSDSKKKDSIPVDQHYGQPGHDFTKHARITLIEQIQHRNKSKEEMTHILEKREDFWIEALDTLHPNGFNQGFKFPTTLAPSLCSSISSSNLSDVTTEGHRNKTI